MRRIVPHYGPHAGVPCYVEEGGTLTPCPPVDSARVPPSVALPEVPEHSGSGVEAGEIAGYDTRASIARMTSELRQNGFRDPDGRAHAAARSWDRGIRDGSITRAA